MACIFLNWVCLFHKRWLALFRLSQHPHHTAPHGTVHTSTSASRWDATTNVVELVPISPLILPVHLALLSALALFTPPHSASLSHFDALATPRQLKPLVHHLVDDAELGSCPSATSLFSACLSHQSRPRWHSTPILSNKALGPHRSHHRRQRLSSARLLTRCSSLPSRLERSRSKLFPTWLSGRLPPPAPPALPFHPLAWSSAPVHQPPAPSITPPTPTPITHPARHQQIRPTPPMAYHRLPTSLMSARLSSADCRMPTGLMKR